MQQQQHQQLRCIIQIAQVDGIENHAEANCIVWAKVPLHTTAMQNVRSPNGGDDSNLFILWNFNFSNWKLNKRKVWGLDKEFVATTSPWFETV